MRSLGGICRWVLSLPAHWTCRSGDYRAALREGDAMLNHPNRAVALHVEAADGRVLSLVVRDGRLRLRGDLANEDAVQLVMESVDFALRPAPGAAIFSVTVDGRTSEVRRSDGHLVYSGDLPTSLPVRLFMASVAEAIEARYGASMCGAISLDGRRVRSCQRWPHREALAAGQLSAALGDAQAHNGPIKNTFLPSPRHSVRVSCSY
jgi:hypothetical protein